MPELNAHQLAKLAEAEAAQLEVIRQWLAQTPDEQQAQIDEYKLTVIGGEK